MKKVLLATTALVLSAGVASAEISLSGGGYVGVDGTTNDLNYSSRFDLNVSGSVESESGVSISAFTRIRTSNGATAVATTPRINVSVGAVTLSFGNTDSAIRARSNPWASCVGNLGDYCAYSVIGNGFSSTNGAGADRVRLDYAAGDFTVSVSSSFSGEDTELGASGKMGAVSANVGYKMAGDTDASYVIDLGGAFGTVNAGVRYGSDAGADAEASVYGNTTFGATTAGIYLSNDDADAWGVGMSHDLGGGVAFGAAIADNDLAQAHISFSF